MRKLSTDLIKSGSFTGSFSGSVIGTITSASYALTASTVLNAFSLTTGSTYSITASWSNYNISSSFSNTSTSSSYANTSSNLSPVAQNLIPSVDSLYNLGSITNKWKDLYVSSGSIYIGDVVLTTSGSSIYANTQPIVTLNTASGQIQVQGLTASLSASFSNISSLANTASYVLNSVSSSFASTSSYAFNSNTATSATSASFSTNSVSASYSITSSYVENIVSSSYALTASFAMNGGGGGTSLVTGSTYPITSSWSLNALTASFAMNGGSEGGSTSLTGITFPYVSGSNTYTLSQSAVAANDLLLSVNGVVQTPTTDYTVSASSVTFTDSYPSGSSVNVRYLVSATSSSFVNLNNIVLTGTTTGDAYYPQVSALLHFDGVNGSTVITDNSKNNLTVTATNGAFISTAQSKFGGSSVFLDGTNDYLSIPDNESLEPGTNNLTWEMWIKTTSSVQYATLYSRTPSSFASGMWSFMINQASSTAGDIALYLGDYSGGVTPLLLTTGVSIRDNVWHHIAIVRNGSAWVCYVDGTSRATGTFSGAISNISSGFIIGADQYYGRYFQGYIDEFRVTNGYARYTGNFTPSTTAFADSGGDVGKALVVNSTATGVSIGTAGYLSSQLAKAWVNFNGTGTVAIRDSYNVSSITDDGTGQYRVNFSTALNNTNYVNFISMGGNSDSPSNDFSTNTNNNSYSQTTTYAVVITRFNGALYDSSIINSIVFSN